METSRPGEIDRDTGVWPPPPVAEEPAPIEPVAKSKPSVIAVNGGATVVALAVYSTLAFRVLPGVGPEWFALIIPFILGAIYGAANWEHELTLLEYIFLPSIFVTPLCLLWAVMEEKPGAAAFGITIGVTAALIAISAGTAMYAHLQARRWMMESRASDKRGAG